MKLRYAVVIEKAPNNYSAYVPDLPGCVATGRTSAEAEKQIKLAIREHLEALAQSGCPIPPSTTVCEYIETQLAAAPSVSQP